MTIEHMNPQHQPDAFSSAASGKRPRKIAKLPRARPARRLDLAQARRSEAELQQASFMGLYNVARPLPPLAKLDAASVLVLGLFSRFDRSAPATEERLEFKKTLRDGDLELTVSCGRRLGDSDQRVLRGLVALATDQYAALAADRLYGRAPVDDPSLKVRVKVTLERLAQAAGFGSPGAGPTNKVLRDSLRRLADVKLRWVSAAGGEAELEEMLITNEGAPTGHKGVNVTFNSRLQAAILASRPGEQYIKLGMDEARALQSPISRLLHHRLAHMNESTSTDHGVVTLERYVWPLESSNRHAVLDRRRHLYRAMEELRTVGWRFDVSAHPGCVLVVRPVANAFREGAQLATRIADLAEIRR